MFKFTITHLDTQMKRTWFGAKIVRLPVETVHYSRAEDFHTAAMETIKAYPSAEHITYIVR